MPEKQRILYQPLKPFRITQSFGQNMACIGIEKGDVITCDGNNPPEGYRSIYGPEGHTGLDLVAYHGQEVYCAQDGVVYKIDTAQRNGLDVRVESEIDDRRIRHIYEHLLGYQPKVGDFVKAGQLIGWADNTGWSSGDHLHFQVEEFINGKWKKIDPLPEMEPVFAKDILRLTDKIAYARELIAKLADNLADKLRKVGNK